MLTLLRRHNNNNVLKKKKNEIRNESIYYCLRLGKDNNCYYGFHIIYVIFQDVTRCALQIEPPGL